MEADTQGAQVGPSGGAAHGTIPPPPGIPQPVAGPSAAAGGVGGDVTMADAAAAARGEGAAGGAQGQPAAAAEGGAQGPQAMDVDAAAVVLTVPKEVITPEVLDMVKDHAEFLRTAGVCVGGSGGSLSSLILSFKPARLFKMDA